MNRCVDFVVLLLTCSILTCSMLGCGGAGTSSSDASSSNRSRGGESADLVHSVTELPTPPILVSAPPAPSRRIEELDLSQYDPATLGAFALQQSRAGDYEQAITLQHWSVVNGGGDDGLYNLACFYGLNDDVDGSIYWLQQAALKQGVDADWASQDSDLVPVRADPRWRSVVAFLRECATYWETADVLETRLIVPNGYDGKKPIGVMIGLHGMGSRAKRYVDEDLQEFADEKQIAFLAVSGSVVRGPTSFNWSEDPRRDLAQIDRGIAAVSDRLVVDPQRVGLFGFSQGAMMSIEIAARHPERFAGALAISPGGQTNVNLASVVGTPLHPQQGYVIVVGAEEHPGNVAMAAAYAAETNRLKSKVIHQPYPGISTHSYPADFYERLPIWIDHILGRR